MDEVCSNCGNSRGISILFEMATYLLAAVILIHAIFRTNKFNLSDTGRTELHASDQFNRLRWITTLVIGVAFGVGIEMILIGSNGYYYGEHFKLNAPDLFGSGKDIPVCIGVGWGIHLYSGTWVAQRLKQPTMPRALFAGLLALDVDASLDPVARMGGLWCGKACPPNFYGVPYDNYIGWMLIVVSYSFGVRALFQCADRKAVEVNKPSAALWVPLLAAGIATGFTFVVDRVLNLWVYKFCPDWLAFFGFLGVAVFFVGRGLGQVRRNLRRSAAILAVPIVYHGLCWICVLASSTNVAPVHWSLGPIAIPLAFIIGLVGFNWGSRGVLFSAATD